MRKLLFILVFLLIISQNTVLADVFSKPVKITKISNELPEITNTSCKFTQEKFLVNSQAKLKSGGNFTFNKSSGVTFETLYPVKSTVSYTKSTNRKVDRIVNAILNKNYSYLEKNFDTYFEKNSGAWAIGLIPKTSSAISEGLKSIKISGNSYIKFFEIKTKNGDITTLNFVCTKG